MTAQALMGYSLSFIPLALREVYSRVQYGYQDSKHPAVNSVIGIACNVTLSILLCRKFGVFGVTLASSVATLVIGMLNVQRRLTGIFGKGAGLQIISGGSGTIVRMIIPNQKERTDEDCGSR